MSFFRVPASFLISFRVFSLYMHTRYLISPRQAKIIFYCYRNLVASHKHRPVFSSPSFFRRWTQRRIPPPKTEIVIHNFAVNWVNSGLHSPFSGPVSLPALATVWINPVAGTWPRFALSSGTAGRTKLDGTAPKSQRVCSV